MHKGLKLLFIYILLTYDKMYKYKSPMRIKENIVSVTFQIISYTNTKTNIFKENFCPRKNNIDIILWKYFFSLFIFIFQPFYVIYMVQEGTIGKIILLKQFNKL